MSIEPGCLLQGGLTARTAWSGLEQGALLELEFMNSLELMRMNSTMGLALACC